MIWNFIFNIFNFCVVVKFFQLLTSNNIMNSINFFNQFIIYDIYIYIFLTTYFFTTSLSLLKDTVKAFNDFFLTAIWLAHGQLWGLHQEPSNSNHNTLTYYANLP